MSFYTIIAWRQSYIIILFLYQFRETDISTFCRVKHYKVSIFILVPFTEKKKTLPSKFITTIISGLSTTNSRLFIFAVILIKMFKNCNGFASVT